MKERKKEIEVQAKKMIADFQERNTDTSVRVFITWASEGNCYSYTTGGGDWYAQYGYVIDWVELQKARTWAEQKRVDAGPEDEEKTF